MARPVTLECIIDIPAPAEQVWQAITDWPSQGTWMPGTKVWVEGSQAEGIGATIAAFTGLGRLGFLDTMTVTVWNPPLDCEVEHTGRVVRGTGWMSVRPATGALDSDQTPGCKFIWGERLTVPGGWLGRVAWVVTGPAMKVSVAYALRRFRAAVLARI